MASKSRMPTRTGSVATAQPARTAFTRVAAAWWALVAGVFFLILLLVFIAQNTEPVAMHFLTWDWSLPTGVAYLLSAVCGAAIVVLIGVARMVQLGRAAKSKRQ